jgi:hypothetical protein
MKTADSYQEIDLMKKVMLITLMVLAVAAFAAAQIQAPTSDVLGAHLNYGRGCAGCHAPHSGERGNGISNGDTTSGQVALWGQNIYALYGQSFTTGGGSYVLTIPSSWTSDPVVIDTATCLSCHDGNLAQGAMMKNKVYETVPSTYSSNNIPTLIGNSGNGAGNPSYLADHPVGDNAIFGCGGQYNWDCTISANGYVDMTGPNSSAFVQDYGFFVAVQPVNNQPTVQCTTCHNQHLMNVVSVTNDGGSCTLGRSGSQGCSGLPTGNYATMFFIRAPYNPASGTSGSNQTAQFCRQCHGGESNEANGATGNGLKTVF